MVKVNFYTQRYVMSVVNTNVLAMREVIVNVKVLCKEQLLNIFLWRNVAYTVDELINYCDCLCLLEKRLRCSFL